MNDYNSEFYFSMEQWLSRLQFVRGDGRDRRQAAESYQAYAALYGKHVIPDELLPLLNNGLDVLEHFVAEADQAAFDADPAASRAKVLSSLTDLLRKNLLMVDEHPTATRFFTFREHFDRLLLFTLLGAGKHVIKLEKVSPQKKNKGRMASVHRFWALPGTEQYLKRTSLCLQITGMVHACCARKDGDKEPLLVRLCKGLENPFDC